MTDQWTWTYADGDGAVAQGASTVHVAFPTQSEAESWLGETWQQLSDEGIASVSLFDNGELVYGPMSLSSQL